MLDDQPVPLLRDAEGGIVYWPGVLVPVLAQSWFGQLLSSIAWHGQQRWMYERAVTVPRLMARNSPRLVVKRHADKATVIDIPLNKYLLLMQSDRYDMGDQEYLDRESRWTLFFFLKNNDGNDSWLNTCIVVNDWVVRINDVEL